MNDRFHGCNGYEGTIEQWLGKTMYAGGRNLNRALHDPVTRKSVKYHGINCLLDLCTGDFSEMIRMVGEIFREARIEPGMAVRQIEPAVQDRAIRYVSRDFFREFGTFALMVKSCTMLCTHSVNYHRNSSMREPQ
jgi:hypothetical protein